MKLIDKMLDIVFPKRLVCLSCGREAEVNEAGFCAECALGVELFNSAPPLEGIEGFTAVYVYNEVSSRMVKRLKYQGKRYMAKPLAEKLVIPEDWQIDAIVPVPLHYKRERERGFNQSELIAKHLAKRLGLKLDTGLLARIKNTKQQAELTVAGRKRNVKDAFCADERAEGLNVLLIDDVRTTGATLVSCAEALKRFGCGKVFAATVCFASGEGRDK